MIAKYHNAYFKVCVENNHARIWCFSPFEDFSMRITRGGNHLYEKNIDISETDEIFDVGFSALWNGKWCGANPSRDGQIASLILGWSGGNFAKENGFYEIERDKGMVVAWGLDVSIDDCEQFRVVIEREYPVKEEKTEILSKEHWLNLYLKINRELSPSYYTTK